MVETTMKLIYSSIFVFCLLVASACTSPQTPPATLSPTNIPTASQVDSEPQPTQSFYFEPLDGLVETQNEIEVKVIDAGKDAQSVFVDICFSLPDNQKDWFVSFETSAVAKSNAGEQNMSLQKIRLIGFEPFWPFPIPTHRCDRLLFEAFNGEPTNIDLRIEGIVGITKKQKNCAVSDITFDDQIIIRGVSCSSTEGDKQNQEGSKTIPEEVISTIQGTWIFNIHVP